MWNRNTFNLERCELGTNLFLISFLKCEKSEFHFAIIDDSVLLLKNLTESNKLEI